MVKPSPTLAQILRREAERAERFAQACDRAARDFDADGMLGAAQANRDIAAEARRRAQGIRRLLAEADPYTVEAA